MTLVILGRAETASDLMRGTARDGGGPRTARPTFSQDAHTTKRGTFVNVPAGASI